MIRNVGFICSCLWLSTWARDVSQGPSLFLSYHSWNETPNTNFHVAFIGSFTLAAGFCAALCGTFHTGADSSLIPFCLPPAGGALVGRQDHIPCMPHKRRQEPGATGGAVAGWQRRHESLPSRYPRTPAACVPPCSSRQPGNQQGAVRGERCRGCQFPRADPVAGCCGVGVGSGSANVTGDA